MKLKVALLLFLLFFASIGIITLVNLSITPNNLKIVTFTSGFSISLLGGGDPVDDPTGV